MPSEDIDLKRVVETLNRHGVRYVVIGGLAVYLHGGETPTLDVDLAFAQSDENIERLSNALADLGARPKRGQGTSFRLAKTDLVSWLHLESEAGDIDLIAKPPGATFEAIDEEHIEFDLDGVLLRVASPESLIQMKRKAGRPRDMRHVEELEAIRKLNERQ